MKNNVPGMTWETHLAIIRERERIEDAKDRRWFLRQHHHFHDFGHDRVCKCGLEQRDYHMRHMEDDLVCPARERGAEG